MNRVTQVSLYRQSLNSHTRYRTNRQYIYRWMRRYDGTLTSLCDQSRRPHRHPNQHRPDELKLINDMRRRNPHVGLVVFWVKLRQRGYERSITGLYRVLRRTGQTPVKPPNPKYIPKPYEQMTYPGQRIQIDVKHVPAACLAGELKGQKLYQYTAIDEYSRLRYLEGFEETSTYSSTVFLDNAIAFFKKHGFSIQCVQTDNGAEFTRRFSNGKPTLFEQPMDNLGITHKLIKPFTPRHNGKVERSIRKDNEYFYAVRSFFSFDDFKKQLRKHMLWYNNFHMRPLNWRFPLQFLPVTYH